MINSRIALVTVLYNSEKVLSDFFATLNNQTFKNFELFVVDNNSTDKSLALTKELTSTVFFKTNLIVNNENYGVAKGNNQGILQALANEFEFVLLTNNDIVLEDTSIENLLNGLITNNADITVPKIFYYDVNKLWFAGGKFKFFPGSIKHFGLLKKDCKKYNVEKKIYYAPTCFMLIKSKVFFDIGLMDEKYFVYFDDTDFDYRATKINHKKMMYIPTSIIRHKESSCTGGTKSDFKIKYYYRNKILFTKKFSHFSTFVYILNIIYFYLKKIIHNDNTTKKIISSLTEGYLN